MGTSKPVKQLTYPRVRWQVGSSDLYIEFPDKRFARVHKAPKWTHDACQPIPQEVAEEFERILRIDPHAFDSWKDQCIMLDGGRHPTGGRAFDIAPNEKNSWW